MAQSVETEIKLVASPAALELLRAHPKLAGADHSETLVTTYFDTTGGRLRRGGAALRIRDGRKGREQTLKLASHGGSTVKRGEWNVAAATDVPEPGAFPVRARGALVRLLNGEPLHLVATTRIERTTRRLHHGSSAIEVAFDIGTIEAGEREDRVCELELELVEGRLADLLALALQLPLGPELGWSVLSKAERCHALAFDLQPAASLAQAIRLRRDMNAAQAFQAIAWNCLNQLLANYPLVVASGDPGGLHQARVAIRRLRAALTLFKDIAGDETGSVLRAELKAVALALGPARDLHVLVERVGSGAGKTGDDRREMLDHLAIQRDKAVASAQTLLAAAPFQRLLFEFAAWLEGGEWLERTQETGGDQPILPFAAQVLSHRRRKLRRAGRHLADLSDADRHRLRISAKKLRYAATFFASLFTEPETSRDRNSFARALRRLQDSLGELNDMAVAAARRDDLFAGLEPITAARHSAQLEAILAAQENARSKLLRSAGRALDVITSARPWWKPGEK